MSSKMAVLTEKWTIKDNKQLEVKEQDRDICLEGNNSRWYTQMATINLSSSYEKIQMQWNEIS